MSRTRTRTHLVLGMSAAGALVVSLAAAAPAMADNHWTLTVEPDAVTAGEDITVTGTCPNGGGGQDTVPVYAGSGFEGGFLGRVPIGGDGVVSGSVTIPENAPGATGTIDVVCPDAGTVLEGPLTVYELVTQFTAQHDWNGDLDADVLAIQDDGDLILYPGNSAAGWGTPRQIGSGWQTRDQVQMAGDWDGDGDTDIIARNPDNGDLWLYRGDGSGGFSGWGVIGIRWNVFDEIVAPGDWDNDGDDDLIARRASDGALFLYEGDGAGGFDDSLQIGTGWQTRDLITPVGDWNGDGNNDLLARNPANGDLWLYAGNGIGAFSAYRPIGSGWNQFDALVGPGDFSGDVHSDVLARTSAGDLYMYRGDGTSGWLWPYPRVGIGWADLRIGG